MHELALAESIVGIATRHAGGRRVAAVEVRVGHLRQVVPSALEFAFELCVHGTPLEGAELRMTEVPARVACRACGGGGEVDAMPLACPTCASLDIAVVGGEELLVDSLEIYEEVAVEEGS